MSASEPDSDADFLTLAVPGGTSSASAGSEIFPVPDDEAPAAVVGACALVAIAPALRETRGRGCGRGCEAEKSGDISADKD